MDEELKEEGVQEGPEQVTRREFLQGVKKWSGIVAAMAVAASIPDAPVEAGWANGRGGYGGGGGGWLNNRGGGGGWLNNRGGGGWLNGHGGYGGGGWINGRGGGGGGSWVNRHY